MVYDGQPVGPFVGDLSCARKYFLDRRGNNTQKFRVSRFVESVPPSKTGNKPPTYMVPVSDFTLAFLVGLYYINTDM